MDFFSDHAVAFALVCALFAVGVTSRWSAEGIFANAVMPGAVPTSLQRHVGGMKTPMELRKTVAEGAATSVLVAASPWLEGIGGRYFADCHEARLIGPGEKDIAGVAAHALNADAAERLWDESLRLLAAWS